MTKKKLAKKFIKKSQKKFIQTALIKYFIGAFFIFMSSCQSRSEKLYIEAYEKINKNQFSQAIELLKSSSLLEKDKIKKYKALFEAARLLRFELHEYANALVILRKIVLESPEVKIRLLSQEAIAEIYFDHFQNYTEALNEYLILEPLLSESKKKDYVRFKIAQAHTFLGNLLAGLEYVEIVLKHDSEIKTSFLKLKAQILQSQQKYDESLKIYQYMFEIDKDYFIQENLFSLVSSVQEEKKDYKGAIDYLDKNKDLIVDKNYLELRIKKLKEKQLNKPFSRGIRK